jgi:signal transduction histidine kinase
MGKELQAGETVHWELKKIREDQEWAAQKTNEGIKILYKELENKNKKLEQFDRLKDEFVNNVSHELRTPLTIIQESVSVMADGLLGEINENQKKHLGITLVNIERLGIIINDLLDISTIENGKLKLNKENIDINALVEEVVLNFTPQIEKKGLTIKSVVPKDRVDVFVDKEKMIQVLVNLVGNACKFTDKGTIEVSVFENDDKVECRVKDTGIGLAPEDIPRLFSKFEQIGREPGAGPKGTGLGLSIAKGIIESHNGQVKVESELGQGTSFTVILPRKKMV